VMAWLNSVGILILQQPAFNLLRDFERQQKLGLDPEFDPQAVGIKKATFWEERWAKMKAGEHVPQG
ncbi:sodium:alanine symporter, partial [Burkholderia multivorans]